VSAVLRAGRFSPSAASVGCSALERPLVLGALDEAVGVAHLQPHFWLLRPASLLAVQEFVEEPFLLLASVVGVEVGPMLDAVHFEPFLLRCRAHKTFEIATRV
jgi:hypothetical protein